MPKLWRAPIPMVRITAPQITAIQKLRCCGLAAASDAGMGLPALCRIAMHDPSISLTIGPFASVRRARRGQPHRSVSDSRDDFERERDTLAAADAQRDEAPL